MRARINGIHINYELTGSGKPLALIHGLGGDTTSWANLVPSLSPHYQVLNWDCRGFGKSDKPADKFTLELFAQDLSKLLQALSIPHAFVMGVSLGGVIAQRFALDYPEMTAALILISTSSELNEAASLGWERVAENAERGGSEALQTPLEIGLSPKSIAQDPGIVARLAAAQPKNDPGSLAKAARAVARYNYTKELENIRCPTLIIQGEDDRLTPPGGSVIMHRHIPGSKLLFLKDCGHSLTFEKPKAVEQAVLEFLAPLAS